MTTSTTRPDAPSAARLGAADLARIAVFAALIVVLGMVIVPLAGGVPVTGQTLGVMLAGTVLGARRAPWAVLLVLVLAAIGLPVLAGGRGGLGVFAGPSAGYLLGWVAGALVIGVIARFGSGRLRWWRVALGCLVGGIGVVYLFGIPVQALVLGTPLAPTALSALVFLPGDLIKVALATVLTLALARAYPAALRFPSRTDVAGRRGIGVR
jgi:biotin transport system substrate-specific component